MGRDVAIDIGTLGILTYPSGTNTPVVVANDINNGDQVVGSAIVGTDSHGLPITHAFVWNPQNNMTDLNDLIPSGSGIVLTQATGINNSGDIAAIGYRVGDNPYIQRGYLLKSQTQPLIFVPGISGSTLYEANEQGNPVIHNFPSVYISELWARGLLAPDSLGLSKLYLDAQSEPHPSIVAVDALDTVLTRPIYKTTFDYLTSHGYVRYETGLHPKKRIVGEGPTYCDGSERYNGQKPTLFVFAYDWRKTNVEAASKLNDFIACVQQFYPGQKVNILTHSMGGLVARRYLIDHESEHKVDKLITIAAPFLGAPKAFDVLYTGRFIDLPFGYYYKRDTIKRITSYSKGAHELIPSMWYYELGERPLGYRSLFLGLTEDYSYQEAKDVIDKKFPSHPYETSEAFHDYYYGLQDNWSLDGSGVKFYHFYGVQKHKKTPGKILILPFAEFKKFGTEIKYTTGDGTVPAVSARRGRDDGSPSVLTAPNSLTKRCTSPYFFSDSTYDHTALMKNPIILEEIRAALNNSFIYQPECEMEGTFALKNRPRRNELTDPDEINTVKIYGVDRLQLTDEQGNTNTPITDNVDEAVPDIDYVYGSKPSDELVAPHEVTFVAGHGLNIKFVAPTGKIRIELYRETENDERLETIKYLDLQIPEGKTAWLKFNQTVIVNPPTSLNGNRPLQRQSLTDEVQNLRYDMDGDGEFETEVQPSVNLSGNDANDTTAPDVSISVASAGNIATISITATDDESGVDEISYRIDDSLNDQIYSGPFTVDVTESHLLYVSAMDNAGNRNLSARWLDIVPPSTTSVLQPSPNSDGWNNTDVDLELTAIDDIGGSGIEKLTYKAEGAQPAPQEDLEKEYNPFVFPERATALDVFQKEFNISTEGITTYTFHSKDRAGNSESERTVTIKLDRTPPVSHLSTAPGTQNVVVSLLATDSVSGVKNIMYSIDGNSPEVYSVPFLVAINEGHFVNFFAVDVAGNEETSRTYYVGSGNRTPFDFDGDRKTDPSFVRASDSNWHILRSQAGYISAQFWENGSEIIPGDYDGDGKTDIAYFRQNDGFWFVFNLQASTFSAFPFGAAGDVPIAADMDGDGKADPVIFRPSTGVWYTMRSSDSQITTSIFGGAGDVPAVADYDGDGKDDVAVFRPNGASGAEWWYVQSSDGLLRAFSFGIAGDKAVPGDYTGDGKADVAFYRPSTGQWFVLQSEDFGYYAFPFGAAGDIPVPGDYDGDGRFDAAVFRPSDGNWYVNGSTAGVIIQHFGAGGDLPVPNAYVH